MFCIVMEELNLLKMFEALFKKYAAHHKVGLGYHPQTSRLVQIRNLEIKSILETTVVRSRKDRTKKLDDALWAYQIAFKKRIGSTPFQLVFGKSCHLPMKLQLKAFCAIKHLNFDLKALCKKRLLQLNKLEKIHMDAYENA